MSTPARPGRRRESALVLTGAVAAKVDRLFWTKVTVGGASVAHCRGKNCDPNAVTCGCLCTPCGVRRGLYQDIVAEVYPTLEGRILPAPRSLNDEVAERWMALCAAEGVKHCGTEELCEDGVLCACACPACWRVLELLAHAEVELLGGG